MAAPIRPPRKRRFFIKITISQYHDIDISYIDIGIGKNAFSMTSLLIDAGEGWWTLEGGPYEEGHKRRDLGGGPERRALGGGV